MLQPTSFGAVHTELEADASMLDEAFGEDATVVAVNMLGNGVSFSYGEIPDGEYIDEFGAGSGLRLQLRPMPRLHRGASLQPKQHPRGLRS